MGIDPKSSTTPAESPSPSGTRPHGSLQPHPNKHWHHRGYLPHFDAAEACQAITYRLADSLPGHVVEQFRRQVAAEPDEIRSRTLRRLIEAYADAGHGSCLLRDPDAARIVLEGWRETDGQACEIHAAVVMPNHVHLLIRQREGHPLHLLLTRWKSQSSRLINRRFARTGPLWMPDYWDRYIRDVEHWQRAMDYIRMNPVQAGLAATPDTWPWKL